MPRPLARPVSCAALLTALCIVAGCRKPAAPPDATPPSGPPTAEQLPESTPQPAPAPPLLTIPFKKLDVAKLFNGINVKTSFTADFGGSASAERNDAASYELDLQLRVRVPRPHQSMGELLQLNPELGTVLPDLPLLLETGKVSPLYEEFYQRKVANIQTNLARLDAILSRHNFFDIETILELESPLTQRRVLLIQSDMDVDTDGSDGDRVPTMEGVSGTFQPFTSYRWPKLTSKPNPFLAVWEKRLKETEKELGNPNVAPARQKELQETRSNLKNEILQLKKSSFLVGSVDPFVVLPLPAVSRKDGQPAARIGDYCVVIHGGRLFPAVVGDAGPSLKSGEGSLRLCREISARANLANRAESDLKVTYLVFPNTAEPNRAAPALEKWWIQCDLLLGEIGGYRGELTFWQDLTKPAPAPPPWDPNFIGPSPEFYGPPAPR
jgi:hypothetical protein